MDYVEMLSMGVERAKLYLTNKPVLESILAGHISFEQWELAASVPISDGTTMYDIIVSSNSNVDNKVRDVSAFPRMVELEPHLFTLEVLEGEAAKTLLAYETDDEYTQPIFDWRILALQVCSELAPGFSWSLKAFDACSASPGFPLDEIMSLVRDMWSATYFLTAIQTGRSMLSQHKSDPVAALRAKFALWEDAQKRSAPDLLDDPTKTKKRRKGE